MLSLVTFMRPAKLLMRIAKFFLLGFTRMRWISVLGLVLAVII